MSHKILTFLSLVVFTPGLVFAHETRVYEINGVEYEIIVGSRNEPVIVDDKSGVDLEIVRDGKFLEGAQNDVQVEVRAGEVSKVMNFEPIFGSKGRYKAVFIATVPTTLEYRIFGELESTPIDLLFTCNPTGHPQSDEIRDRVEVASGIVQTLKKGTFGCPNPKEDFGFPEPASSLVSLAADPVSEEPQTVPEETKETNHIAVISLVLSILALGGVGYLLVRKEKPQEPQEG